MSDSIILDTERTVVRELSLDDASFFVELLNTPDWLRFIGDRKVRDLVSAETYLANSFLRSYAENGFGYYLIQLNNAEPMGICGFLKKSFLQYEDFGFALLPKYQGLGYGFEAAAAILKYGVDQFNFAILDAVTDPRNIKSKALLQKLDFEFEGKLNPSHAGKLSIANEDLLDLYRWKKT